MQIEGLIHFKTSTDQAITSLYFLRICSSFFSFSSVKLAVMITALSAPKKAYFKCLGSSFRINPPKLFYTPCSFSSLLPNLSILISFRLSVISLNSKLEFRYSIS